jgi:eukaryotic-like serine/threonine-protein kinase
MSTVYRAFDETLERPVAIKVLHREISSDPSQRERFRREARTVARLSHPHIVTVIDVGEDADGYPFIVFQYVDGETLKERIHRVGPLPVPEALAYAIEICRGLEAAHTSRLVHRDVKPQNVLINSQGRAKVTDFGIARSLEHEGTLTDSGSVLGTTDYLSPEQALGETVTEKSDLYSLGICLYEMLTGEVPFKADNQVGAAMKHIREPMPDVQRKRPELSANLAAIIDRATAKSQGDRYSTATEMISDLERALAIEVARTGEEGTESTSALRVLSDDTVDFSPLESKKSRRKWVFTLVLASCALLLLALAGSQLGTQSRHPNPPAQSSGGGGGLQPVQLAATPAGSYNPPPGDGSEHPERVGAAVDGNPSTSWDTQTYASRNFGSLKPGVGLYLRTQNPVSARAIRISTPTPGWTGQIYASNTDSPPSSLNGWAPVSPMTTVDSEQQQLPVDTQGRPYRYYLLWISVLPPSDRAQISELALFR